MVNDIMNSAMKWVSEQNDVNAQFSDENVTAATLNLGEAEKEFLTTADLPPRESGGDPLHAVESAHSFKEQRLDDAGSQASGSLASLTEPSEFTLPQWIVDPNKPPPIARKEPLHLATPVFTWCARTTHSDVTCVINTTRNFSDEVPNTPGSEKLQRYSSKSHSSFGKSKRLPPGSSSSPLAPRNGNNGAGGRKSKKDAEKMCRLPYSGNKSSGVVAVAKPRATTLLAELQNAEARARRNAEMLAERFEFMQRLKQQRSASERAEACAAVKIQSAWRGFRARPRTEAWAALGRERAYRKAGARGEPSVIMAALRDLDEELGLGAIPGVTLPKRKLTKKEQSAQEAQHEIETFAAVKVQGRVRILCAKHDVEALKAFKEDSEAKQGALYFQRVFRGSQVRKSQYRLREEDAAHVLQRFARSSNAFMKAQGLVLMAKEGQRIVEHERKAVTRLQAAQRGSITRRKTLTTQVSGDCVAPDNNAEEELLKGSFDDADHAGERENNPVVGESDSGDGGGAAEFI